jgi:hypothetical protein
MELLELIRAIPGAESPPPLEVPESTPAPRARSRRELPVVPLRSGGLAGRTITGLAAGPGRDPELAPELMYVEGHQHDPLTWVVRVRGDSMEPTIGDGERVALRAFDPVLELGAMEDTPSSPAALESALHPGRLGALVAVAVNDDGATIKRLFRSP